MSKTFDDEESNRISVFVHKNNTAMTHFVTYYKASQLHNIITLARFRGSKTKDWMACVAPS